MLARQDFAPSGFVCLLGVGGTLRFAVRESVLARRTQRLQAWFFKYSKYPTASTDIPLCHGSPRSCGARVESMGMKCSFVTKADREKEMHENMKKRGWLASHARRNAFSKRSNAEKSRTKVYIAIFAKQPSLTIDVAEREKNTNGATSVVSGSEDDAPGGRPQLEITRLPVLCPVLRMMRSWRALKYLI